MWHTRFSFPYLLVAALLAATATSASAQESLEAVRALYASAAYEDALAMVTRLRGADDTPEVAQVRVFCLIALGRTGEAEKPGEHVRRNPAKSSASADLR